MNLQATIVTNKRDLWIQDDEPDHLNQIRTHMKRQYFIGSRAEAEKLIQQEVDKRRAGISVPPEESICGVLCVGNEGNKIVEYNRDILDCEYLNLAGKTDMTCDPMQGKIRSTAKERVSRHRVEPRQTETERNCTALDAWALQDAAFARNKKGILIIHCEHGFHRAPAYGIGLFLKQRADRIVMDHMERAGPDEQNFTLDMTRCVASTLIDFWGAFGKPATDSQSNPETLRPYSRIVRKFKSLTAEIYSDIPPAMQRPYRESVVKSRIAIKRQNCPQIM